MIKMYYGGASCGKSEIAEDCAVSKSLDCVNPKLTYIATMLPYGEEVKRRIARHKKMRAGKGFEVIEQYYDIGNTNICGGTVLLECVGNILANEMFHNGINSTHVCEYVIVGIKQLATKCDHLIIVSNDLSDGADNPTERTIEYINNLERINKEISCIADEVYCVRVGIPVKKKNEKFI